MNVVLFNPKFACNVGTVARLCVSQEWNLHIIQPFGDSKKINKQMHSSSCGYIKYLNIVTHTNWNSFLAYIAPNTSTLLLFTVDTKEPSFYQSPTITTKRTDRDLYFVFGNETSGLPKHLSCLAGQTIETLTIPMKNPIVNSLNLSTSVAIVVYEVERQLQSQ